VFHDFEMHFSLIAKASCWGDELIKRVRKAGTLLPLADWHAILHAAKVYRSGLGAANMSIPRTALCPCGSRQRYKHCCGAPSDAALKPTNRELESLAFDADDEGLRLGEEPSQRAFMNVLRILAKLGIEGVPLMGEHCPQIVKRVHQANDRLFRPIDQRDGGYSLRLFHVQRFFLSSLRPSGVW
jgi:hypothetical protein